jgi:hypothetical protein
MSTSPSFSNSRFVPRNIGEWGTKKLQMIASVAIGSGSAVYRVLNGTHTKATSSTSNFAGILIQDIAATDSDYATSLKLKDVYVPLTPRAEVEFTVGAGTFTTADVGKSVALTNETSVAVDTAGTQFVITGYISATRGIGYFNDAIAAS